ncbi:DUF4388 domain-containing protein [Thermodesulfobacteriota bacterium]
MALEGEIKEFGVADILQLMAQQQKTGILVVEHKDQSAEVYFRNGEIAETRSSKQMARLGDMLVQGKLIEQGELKKVLDKQKDTFEQLGQILIKDGYLKKEQLERIVLTQCYETFYDILQWRDGTYRFITEKVRSDSSLPPLPGLESILLDVLRMIDEWPDIKQIIRSFEMVFGKVADRDVGELEEDELPVYSLVDGHNTVQKVISGSLLGRFSTCKILIDLLQDGFIELVAETAAKEKAEERFSLKRCASAGSYAGLALALLVLVLLPTRFPENILPVLLEKYYGGSYLQQYFDRSAVLRLEKALRAFYVQNGSYPANVSDIVAAGFLTEADLQTSKGASISYANQGSYYSLALVPIGEEKSM